jgi:hypothetical protein
VSAPISGLSANTAYHFRVSATNKVATVASADESFKTLSAAAPIVETKAASEIKQTTATLNATVNPNGSEVTECKFEYGTSTTYTQSATCSPAPGSGSSPVGVSAPISALSSGATYHFRVSATTVNATSKGGDESFTTAAGTTTATFGKTTVGASSDYFGFERKRVNRYALAEAGTVSKLSVYLAPAGTAGEQALKGVVYSDASGKPEALLAASEQLTFKSTNAAGWYSLPFATGVKLAAGNYWIGVISGVTQKVAGFRYDSVTGSRDYNANTYSSGPSNPFGAVTSDSEQMSLYATYTAG